MKHETSMTDAERSAFIDQCQMANCTHSLIEHFSAMDNAVPDLPDDPSQGAVAAGNLLAFAEGVSRQNKDDVIDSLLFATLVANKAFNPEKQSEQWYQQYNKVLTTLGWFSTNWRYSRYYSTHRRFSMEQAGLEIISSAIAAAALPGPASVAMLKVAGDAVAALKAQEKPLRIFERQTKTHRGANFRIGACTESSDGTVNLAMGAVNFSTDSAVTNVLFWEWNSAEVQAFRGENHLVLNTRVYAALRTQIQQRLNKSASAAIEEFQI
ncbi:hypothetical protein QWI18_14470 [Pseudomonas sp. W2Oct36]|uniref:Uncharacterized protein n=1 Tax=Pseudomonas graminis TaxID=158627 RepID=A0A1C2E862_9PSED|nr:MULTISPECIES: hypothetical protein [Pseudomonas]MBD8598892.1 hypothetical protein [Pseudomonas sp. CFBP 8772]OCX23172.1 hypothetical protein BBI10_07445 [Pseudomonas graminis]RZI74460.1 MAG: hypothetical protein EOP13_08690 [Pseudomonas sp.]